METVTYIKVTPEVLMDGEVVYLIRIDGSEAAFADCQEDAMLIIDSIANDETKRMQNADTKVYRENLGSSISLSTQKIGKFINGSLTPHMKIEALPIGRATFSRSRNVNQNDSRE